MTTTWDESYPPSVLNPPPPVVPVTGATAGTPGAWVPSNAYPVPSSVAEANALGLALGTAWTAGQYVVLDNPSNTHTYWNGAAFASGNAPPVPTLATVAPDTGAAAGGTAVVLTGTGFTGATGVAFGVTFGSAFSVVNATTINVTTPAHAAGAVDVIVQHPSGNVTKAGGFTYA
jgi:hypothetical protein